jgi:hypothetical protein
MSSNATIRAMEAAQRRQQREAQRRARELERQAKEQAKLSAIDRAHFEVEIFEDQLVELLSVHKEQSDVWDWTAFAASLPSPCPHRHSHHEQKARQRVAVTFGQQTDSSQALVEQAQLHDENEFQNATKIYSEQMEQFEKLKGIARRILAREHKAYTEALVEYNPFASISGLGSAINFTVHTSKLAECVLKINGRKVIPAEVKTLTSSEKLSVKPMPKGRFHEIYQDYLYGCVLRVAREIFALLPLDALLVTAAADLLDPGSGRMTEQPVLSAFMPRAIADHLDYDRLNASDAMEHFRHRGDFKASRKSGTFLPITPLAPADVVQAAIEQMSFHDLLANIREMREDLNSKIALLGQNASISMLQSNPSL